MSKRSDHTAEIDNFVGGRIRQRRTMLGLTQQDLARMLGITYQQAHKYERGINRVSAGRLYEIARILNTPVSYFYEGLDATSPPSEDSARQRLSLELARNFAQIGNARHQEALTHLVRVMATGGGVEKE